MNEAFLTYLHASIEDYCMELAENYEREIERLKTITDCPKGFRCCKRSGCDDVPPAKVYKGANLVQCEEEDRMDCSISPVFCRDIVFCRCPLRRYLAMERNK